MSRFSILTTAAIALGMVMTACSDNNDGDKPFVPVGPAGDPSVADVFQYGLPTQVDGASFTTNAKGLVTKITDGRTEATFEYGNFSRAKEFNVLMKVRNYLSPSDDCDFYMILNRDGYVTYALQIPLNPREDRETWRFEYNADRQLSRVRRSENDDDYRISYINGDITKVVKVDDDSRDTYSFAYTNDLYPGLLPNKGNIMLFDEIYDVDIDEMELVYFAGMLGKSTVNLPVESIELGEDFRPVKYHWEFDANKFPTRFWEGNNTYEAITFIW